MTLEEFVVVLCAMIVILTVMLWVLQAMRLHQKERRRPLGKTACVIEALEDADVWVHEVSPRRIRTLLWQTFLRAGDSREVEAGTRRIGCKARTPDGLRTRVVGETSCEDGDVHRVLPRSSTAEGQS